MTADIHVLCVDDEPAVTDLVAAYLERSESFTVAEEISGRDALDRLDEERIDCVVSDYRMPGMNGLEFLAEVRERRPELPFILFTGEGTEKVASEAVSAGVTDYIRKGDGTKQFDLLANRIRNAVERRRARSNYREIFQAVDDAILVHDADTGDVRDANRAAAELWGYSSEKLTSLALDDLGAETAAVSPADRLTGVDGPDRFDWLCETRDGDQFWAGVSVKRAVIEGEDRILSIVRDVTRRKRREEAFDSLLTAARSMMTASSDREIGRIAVDTAREVLDRDIVVLYRYGETERTLEPVATTEAARSRRDTVTLGPDADVDAYLLDGASWSRIRSERGILDVEMEAYAELRVPIGDRGVLVGGDADEFADHEVDLVEILATQTEAAFDRAEREQLLRDRERELERQRDELESLNHTNEVIRDVNQALVRVSTRDEIERLVCEQFAATDRYPLAWIGEYDLATREITPCAWAGIENGYLDGYDLSAGDEGCALPDIDAVVEDHEVVITAITPETVPEERYHRANERGYRSVALVPVVHQNALYSVIAVYAAGQNTFGESDRSVLQEVGETIGHAMNAVEQRRALVGDRVFELEFSIRDPDSLLFGLSHETGSRVALNGMLAQSDGSIRLFATVAETPNDTVVEHARSIEGVDDVQLLAERDDKAIYEVTIRELPTVEYLAEYGATLRTATAEDGEGRAVVELPAHADARELVQLFDSTYDESQLVARQERSRQPRTIQEFQAALEEQLTDRQHETLQAAYYAGFFEWPRESSGDEIADVLGITQPTFHEHLRTGERKVFAAFFDEQQSVFS